MSMQMYPCPQCAAEFDTFKSLEQHLKAAHSEVLAGEKFRCTTCDAEFLACTDWLRHAEEEHTNEEHEAA